MQTCAIGWFCYGVRAGDGKDKGAFAAPAGLYGVV